MRTTSLLCGLCLLLTLPIIGGDFGPWGTPVNLGPAINSGFGESSPAVSKDGLSLYFQSARPGMGGNDIYVSQRASTNDPWGAPVILGPAVNSTRSEVAPALSRDEHYLFFSSDRAGGKGDFDLYVSYREFTHDDFSWQPAVPITELNTTLRDAGPSYFENEEGRPQLYFARGTPANLDIYVSEQQDDGTWGAPTAISELNTSFVDGRPSIRWDGREIIFYSDRSGNNDLYESHRNSVSDPWSAPQNLGPTVNSPKGDIQPFLSQDGTELYFGSNRTGAIGGVHNLYVSRRSKRGDHD